VCALHLDGCCYVAATTRLLQQLDSLATQPDSWPCMVGFAAGHPQLLVPDAFLPQLQQQMRQLHDAVQQAAAAAAAAAATVPTLDLGRLQLPAMPTLNGLLLGYPLVYHVRDQAGAAAASRALSGAQLSLHHISGACPALLQLLPEVLGGIAERSSQQQRVVLQAFTVPGCVAGGGCIDARVTQLLARLRTVSAAMCGCWLDIQASVVDAGSTAVVL
jgi:hypothetical protein